MGRSESPFGILLLFSIALTIPLVIGACADRLWKAAFGAAAVMFLLVYLVFAATFLIGRGGTLLGPSFGRQIEALPSWAILGCLGYGIRLVVRRLRRRHQKDAKDALDDTAIS